jgi:hypothetical protein
MYKPYLSNFVCICLHICIHSRSHKCSFNILVTVTLFCCSSSDIFGHFCLSSDRELSILVASWPPTCQGALQVKRGGEPITLSTLCDWVCRMTSWKSFSRTCVPPTHLCTPVAMSVQTMGVSVLNHELTSWFKKLINHSWGNCDSSMTDGIAFHFRFFAHFILWWMKFYILFF